jgi:nucleotide-binding universal stress UspA family protein
MSTVPGEKAKKGRRSRIVVNVEDRPPEDRDASVARGRGKLRARRVQGRRRRVLSVAGIALASVVLLLCLAGWWWWQSFKSSPAYTLALAAEAAELDDQQAFEELVDVESVSRSVVPQVIDRVRGADDSLNIPPQVRRQIAQNAQVWLPGVREQVRGVLMAETKRLAEQGGARDYPFFVRAFALSRAGETRTQASGRDNRAATLTYQADQRPVEFGLRGGGEGQPEWRIISVKSDDLAARVAEQVARTFPMTGK